MTISSHEDRADVFDPRAYVAVYFVGVAICLASGAIHLLSGRIAVAVLGVLVGLFAVSLYMRHFKFGRIQLMVLMAGYALPLVLLSFTVETPRHLRCGGALAGVFSAILWSPNRFRGLSEATSKLR